MATGTFTYNALRTETLKERIKTQRKIVSHSNSTRAMLDKSKLDKSNAVSIGMTAVKPHLSICALCLVCFARYCGKMYNRHLFPCGGFGS